MKKPEIEVRHATLDDGTVEFDEIVAGPVLYVHLEKMDDNWFSLIVETTHERACFYIGAARAPVTASEMWRDPRNGYSEGQSRRWARLTPEQRKRRKRR